MREPEPKYPVEALEIDENGESTPAAREAEQKFNDDALLWGRRGWDAVGRLCTFFAGLGMKIDCEAE